MAADVRADERKDAELNDTIYALSSGQPPAAIALIRISGPDSNRALEILSGRLPKPRSATVAELRWQGELLDRALVLRFEGPHSVTGEDIAELHLHGGRSVVGATLAALAQIDGLREALPGEFTRRAFENGRIDLAEAEGLADLLEAETESQRRNALLLAGGALSRQIEMWRLELLRLAAQLEAVLDFGDEDDVGLSPRFDADLGSLANEIGRWLKRPSAERLKEGVRIVIAGPPNAGKSSLLNALAGREAAITAAVPGTTRDLVEVPLAIAGTPVLLVDTAGLRESADEVEAIGVERAEAMIDAADLVLWLGEPELAPARSIRVSGKCDLFPPSGDHDIAVSARTNEGVDSLRRLLIQHSLRLLPALGEVAINARQHVVLRDVHSSLAEAASSPDVLIRAEALRQARASLDRVTGKTGVEDMLDSLFGRFCIGK